MITRYWSALAHSSHADEYIHHLKAETFPSLRSIPGFLSARILKRSVDEGMEFVVITEWTDIDVIKKFAGNDVETAVVPDAVKKMMIRFDTRVKHFETIS